MSEKPIEWHVARYWRNSLADESNLCPDLNGFISVDVEKSIRAGILPITLVDRLFETYKADLHKYNPSASDREPQFVPVLLSQYVISSKVEHGRRQHDAEPQYPLWLPGRVDRQGNLRPTEDGMMPWIARDCLHPFDGEGETLGSVEDSDFFYQNNEERLAEDPSWDDVLNFGADLLTSVCNGAIEYQAESSGFSVEVRGYLVIATREVSAKYPIRAYDYYLKRPRIPPLLKELASFSDVIPQKPMNVDEQQKLSRLHVGQMHSGRSLTPSQREAMAYYLRHQKDLFFVVNGPPGTGKTTLLQSVIATEWVQAALISKGMPAIIVVSSSNNQAVTNVLDSFQPKGKDAAGHERWIPSLNSFGLYLPSQDAIKKGRATNTTYFHTKKPESLLSFLDVNFRRKAKEFFLQKATNYFGEEINQLSVVESRLQQQLRDVDHDLKMLVDTACLAVQLTQVFNEKFGGVNAAEETRERLREDLQDIMLKKAANVDLQRRFGDFLSGISLLLFLLNIPFIKKWIYLINMRVQKVRVFCSLFPEMSDYEFSDEIELGKYIQAEKKKIRETEKDLKSREQELSQMLDGFTSAVEKILVTAQKNDVMVRQSEGPFDSEFLDYLIDQMDRTLRHRAFFLATHYWESRWLQSTLDLKDYRGNEQSKRKFWQQMAMITPCMVTTFDTGPSFFQYHAGDRLYAYADGMIDLLIVDEAGQSNPAKAGPMVAASRRALFVGDVKQLEPICPVPMGIDQANAKRYGLLKVSAYHEMKALGILHSSDSDQTFGNLMRVGQRKSSALLQKRDGKLYDVKGAHLREHWRCHKEIISYCNELAYDGDLIPCTLKRDQLFRPWMYAHIKGEEESRGGSRFNKIEATALVEWLAKRKEEILNFYIKRDGQLKEDGRERTLSDHVAIVTPFAAQTREIKKLLKANEIWLEKVGTVHSLQGAEKDIVIFSSVYSSGTSSSGYFFDRGTNMLNVAVSRARDTFIAFGDMEIFDRDSSAPSSMMAHYLFDDPLNEIGDIEVRRKYLALGDKVRHLTTLEGHTSELRQAFRQAQETLVIFSPYLKATAIYWDDILNEVKACSQRAKITICFDHKLNNDPEEALNMARHLANSGARVIRLRNIHSKILYYDGRLLVEGSFNWLSAVREPRNTYSRVESSLVYEGPKVKDFMAEVMQRIKDRKDMEIMPNV